MGTGGHELKSTDAETVIGLLGVGAALTVLTCLILALSVTVNYDGAPPQKLAGRDAVNHAPVARLLNNRYADPIEGESAAAGLAEDPRLVYIESGEE